MKDWIKKEQEVYDDLWSKNYTSSHFGKLSQEFPDIMDKVDTKVIDLGCGNAEIQKTFSNYTGVDISKTIIEKNRKNINGVFHHLSLSDLRTLYSQEFDTLIVFDVMEHIPIQMTGLVISEISRLNFKTAYFKIHTGHSSFKDKDGNGLHRTVAGRVWWNHLISNFMTIESESKTGYEIYLKATKNN
jgi:cyclopropane fatty-acyl-phospholipid synthase-like methyltransferase